MTTTHHAGSAAAVRDARRRRLTVGLPVYNGERYLAESLDNLLSQTFGDFRLIISDNASTDGTAEIARSYARADPRVQYVRQAVNIGAAPNHNFVLALANTEFFKWASHDDRYEPTLLERCVQALDRHPEVVLAHAFEAFIGEHGELIRPVDYRLETDSPDPVVRFRSLLRTYGGDDFYGVMRTSMLKRLRPINSYHNADRTFMAQIALAGRFFQVPERLYYRRDHPQRAERAPTMRARAANLDPRRANRWTHPDVRLRAEYIAGFVNIVREADLSSLDRLRCLAALGGWLASRARGGDPDAAGCADPAILAKAAGTHRSPSRVRRAPVER